MSAKLDPTKTIFFPPPTFPPVPGPFDPWPGGPFGPPPITTSPRTTHGPGERTAGDPAALDALLARLVELLSDALERQDYDAVIKAYGPVIQKQLESDPDAMAAFRALFERYGIDLDQFNLPATDEREPVTIGISVTVALIAFGSGAVIGWLAED